MRKTVRSRITLTKKTLRALESGALRGARGGLTAQPETCNASCVTDLSCPGETCLGLACQTAGSICC